MSSSAHEPKAAPSRRSSASSGGRRPGSAGPMPMIRSRTNSTGSVSVSGIRDHEPGGHEHDPTARQLVHEPADEERDRWSDREHDRAGDPLLGREEHRPGCDADGHDCDRGRQDHERDAGRHLEREALLVAVGRTLRADPCELAAHPSAHATAVTATATSRATADASPEIAATIATATATGAPRRTIVVAIGRGTSTALSTTAQTIQSITVATHRVVSDHGCIQSASASPAVTGSDTHDTRSNQVFIGRKRAPLRSARKVRSYTRNSMPTNPHGGVFPPGLATGIGSLPFADAVRGRRARARGAPRPARGPTARIAARGRRGAMGRRAAGDHGAPTTARSCSTRRASASRSTPGSPPTPTRVCSGSSTWRPRTTTAVTRVKTQVVGPLTLGVALGGRRHGGRRSRSTVRGAAVVAWLDALDVLFAAPACAASARSCSSTSPRSCSGSAGWHRSSVRTRWTCSRVRSPRALSRPACTSAATATSGSPSKPGRPCSASRWRTVSSTTSARSCATSTPTAGSRGRDPDRPPRR